MNDEQLQVHKLRNGLQTGLLMAALAGLLASLAWFIGGPVLAWGALIGVVVLAMGYPAMSPRLLMPLTGARPIRQGEAPRLYAIVEVLSRRAGLDRRPVLYLLPTQLMNAFTSGNRQDAAIALSDGLLRRMELRELAGVLAHEISHVANGDIQVMTFADLVSRITAVLSLFGQFLLLVSLPLWLLSGVPLPWIPILLLLFGPTLSALAQLALSRSREFEADRSAAELSGDPEGLASALQQLESQTGGLWERILMPGRGLPEPSLLRTHPPTEERVRRLLELRDRGVLPGPLPEIWEPLPWDRFGLLAERRPSAPRWHIGGLWY